MIPKEVNDIFRAVENVDISLKEVIGKRNDNSDYRQAAENAFTADLYSEIKTIVKTDHHYKGLQIHFDLNKPRANNIRPDIVVHKAPNSREDQRIYIEVKTDLKVALQDINLDLIKLEHAVSPSKDFSPKLGYKVGIYIVAGVELDWLKKILIAPYQDDQLPVLQKLWLIYFTPTSVQLFSFEELYNTKHV